MFLKKFVFVNWGNIPATEFEFGPINLFSGGNGSGKTTAADAIQTIMTAAHDTLFMFNPGQDEATQRGRNKQVRTLASYVLGCDDGSYARPLGAIGYLAAIFYPTAGEDAEPFTALIGCSAILDTAGSHASARQKDMQFFIFPGEQLSLDDVLITGHDGDREVLSMDLLSRQLKKRWGIASVERYDTKRQYLRRLYGALKGRSDGVSEIEALNAARAFSRFMAYKPVRSINEFVAHEILDAKPMGDAVRTISDLMKTIYAMEAEASRLKNAIVNIEQVRKNSVKYVDKWVEHQRLHFVASHARFSRDQTRYLEVKKQQQLTRSELDQVESNKSLAKERRQQVRDHLLNLEAQRQGVDQLKAKDQFEQQISSAESHISTLMPKISIQSDQLGQLRPIFEGIHFALNKSSMAIDVPELGQKSLKESTQKVLDLTSGDAIDFVRLLGKDLDGLAALESHLDEVMTHQEQLNHWRNLWFDVDNTDQGVSLRDQLLTLADKRNQRVVAINQQINSQTVDIKNLNQKQINYPGFVRRALMEIQQHCPDADPKILCDFVEVTDPEWQSAIEGYIGGARFSIVVTPEYESEAISIVRNMPGRDNRARVLQGSKARQDASKIRVAANSILNLMEFSHATVAAWLTANYATVEQVSTTEQLSSTRRGLMSKGMGSGGYSMFRCDVDDSDLVFGHRAREKALKAKEQELAGLIQSLNVAQVDVNEVTTLLKLINPLSVFTHGDSVRELLKHHRSIQTAELGLEQLDLADFENLQAEFDEQQQKLDHQDSEISELDRIKGELEAKLKGLDKRCKELSDLQEETGELSELAEGSLMQIQNIWPDFDFGNVLAASELEAKTANPDVVLNSQKSCMQELTQLVVESERLVMNHHQHAQASDRLHFTVDFEALHDEAMFDQFCQLSRQIAGIHNRLKNNILVVKQDNLAALKEDFSSAFVSNLCHSIFQSINDGKRTLEGLNKELQFHRFGADRETYKFSWEWVPEFKEYWAFFKEIVDNATLGESQTLFNAELSKKSTQVRERLLQMLLDDDEQKALRELERISDYRNYRSYEIFKQPEGKEPIALSHYGTGSGGQLETPAYIIRSAAITSAFRFDEGNSHLRMVLVDEAFSKMDETRSKEVINYLTQTLGLQLMFIMPTSKSGPFMDLISNQYVFSKVPLANQQMVGELKTRVLVDRQKCNQERIGDLWAKHRKVVRQQGALDFLEDI